MNCYQQINNLKTLGVSSCLYFLGNSYALTKSYLSSELQIQNLDSCLLEVDDLRVETVESVLEIYRGSIPENFFEEKVSDSVKFEDPVIQVTGKKDVYLAMESLKLINPIQLNYEIIHSEKTTYINLSQQYSFFKLKFHLKSVVEIHFNDENLIESIIEKWNNQEILPQKTFEIIRKLNGVLIKTATKLIMRVEENKSIIN